MTPPTIPLTPVQAFISELTAIAMFGESLTPERLRQELENSGLWAEIYKTTRAA